MFYIQTAREITKLKGQYRKNRHESLKSIMGRREVLKLTEQIESKAVGMCCVYLGLGFKRTTVNLKQRMKGLI